MPVTNYIWDEVNDTLLMETDEAGNTIAEYSHESGQFGPLISQRRNGDTYYHHYDGLGSTRALTDESGNVTDTYTYDAWGNQIAHTGTTTNPFGYKGAIGYYANPETNDLYVRARHYFPVLARWLSEDPLGRDLDAVAGLYRARYFLSAFAAYVLWMSRHARKRDPNPYHYVGNKPTIGVDPLGLRECYCDCKGLRVSTDLVNDIINGEIDKANHEFAEQDFGPGSVVRTREQVFRDVFASDVPGTGPASETNIEVLLWQKLSTTPGGKFINKGPRMKKTLGIVGTADCMLISCPTADPDPMCIGTDKIGHFFQQGFMLWEVSNAKGADYASAFSRWIEGFLFDATGPNAKAIASWLISGPFTFYGAEFAGVQWREWHHKWGGFTGAPSSSGDLAAQNAGVQFWSDINDDLFRFDICKYAKRSWEGQ